MRGAEIRSTALFVFLAFIFSVNEAVSSEWRIWVDSTGAHSVKARLVEQSSTEAVLEREDGSVVTVAKAKMSQIDLAYLEGIQDAGGPTGPKVAEDAPPVFEENNSGGESRGDDDALGAFYAGIKHTLSNKNYANLRKFCRMADDLIGDERKPELLSPFLLVFGIIAFLIASLWLLIAFFRISPMIGFGLLFFNLIGFFLPLLELVRWIYIIIVAAKNWYEVRTPFVLMFLSIATVMAGWAFLPSYAIPDRTVDITPEDVRRIMRKASRP